MGDCDWLAARFEEHRSRLRAVAYRMLGSLSEADDAIQETWLKLSRTDASGIDNLGAGSRPSLRGSAWTCCVRARHGANSPWPHLPEPVASTEAGPTPSTKRCWPIQSVSRCS